MNENHEDVKKDSNELYALRIAVETIWHMCIFGPPKFRKYVENKFEQISFILSEEGAEGIELVSQIRTRKRYDVSLEKRKK